MIRLHKMPETTHLSRHGLREMEDRDVEAVQDLYMRYMERFDMVPNMTVEEVRHQFMSGRGTGERDASTNRRHRQVVWSYVVEVGRI
jgi:glycylpeptide N-tetradecanoyltransferase